jgi:hypothetical protein
MRAVLRLFGETPENYAQGAFFEAFCSGLAWAVREKKV